MSCTKDGVAERRRTVDHGKDSSESHIALQDLTRYRNLVRIMLVSILMSWASCEASTWKVTNGTCLH